MQLGDYDNLPIFETFKTARKLGLVENLAELETYGFTVVEPGKVATPDFQTRVREAVLSVLERRNGMRITDVNRDPPGGRSSSRGRNVVSELLGEDRIFEQVLLNPVVLTLARYLNGRTVMVSGFGAFVNFAGEDSSLILHADPTGLPPPFPLQAQVCNVSWIHSDYTKENGALAIVPGSHRFCRQPEPYEEDFYREGAPVKPIAVEAPAGSIICWHGNTWHGAWRRTTPGVRVNTAMYFCRSYYRPIHDERSRVTPEMLERNPPEFGELLGCMHPWPPPEGRREDPEKLQWLMRAGHAWDA